MYDMKQWMAGCAVSNLPDYIHQHQFKLIQGPGGRAHLYFKKMVNVVTAQGNCPFAKVADRKPNTGHARYR